MSWFDSALKGGLSGGLTGFMVGGPVGGLVGAGLGGAYGAYSHVDDPQVNPDAYRVPGAEERKSMLLNQASSRRDMGAPTAQAASIRRMQSGGMGGPFRGHQLNLVGQLQQQAAGQGPSLATAQYNQALDSGIAAQMAMARSGQGPAGAAMRGAMQNTGNMTQNLAGQAAQARMQEQMVARQQLAGVLGQGRGQDMAGSQFDAAAQNQRLMQLGQFQQQANLANQQSILQNREAADRYAMGLYGLELQQAMGQQSGQMNAANLAYQGGLRQQENNQMFMNQLMSGVGTAGARYAEAQNKKKA